MLRHEEKERISWDEIFCEPIFKEISEEKISETLIMMESSYKDDILSKTKALNKLYFE